MILEVWVMGMQMKDLVPFAAILDKVSSVIAYLTEGTYVPQKLSVLFSRPHGPQQGLHFDDHQATATIEEHGELLSVIVSLMPHTKVDIATVNIGRKTFTIPTGAMAGSIERQMPGWRILLYYMQCKATS